MEPGPEVCEVGIDTCGSYLSLDFGAPEEAIRYARAELATPKRVGPLSATDAHERQKAVSSIEVFLLSM